MKVCHHRCWHTIWVIYVAHRKCKTWREWCPRVSQSWSYDNGVKWETPWLWWGNFPLCRCRRKWRPWCHMNSVEIIASSTDDLTGCSNAFLGLLCELEVWLSVEGCIILGLFVPLLNAYTHNYQEYFVHEKRFVKEKHNTSEFNFLAQGPIERSNLFTLSRWKTWLKKKLRPIPVWKPVVMGSLLSIQIMSLPSSMS